MCGNLVVGAVNVLPLIPLPLRWICRCMQWRPLSAWRACTTGRGRSSSAAAHGAAPSASAWVAAACRCSCRTTSRSCRSAVSAPAEGNPAGFLGEMTTGPGQQILCFFSMLPARPAVGVRMPGAVQPGCTVDNALVTWRAVCSLHPRPSALRKSAAGGGSGPGPCGHLSGTGCHGIPSRQVGRLVCMARGSQALPAPVCIR